MVVRIPRLGIRPGHREENENHVDVRSDEEKADVEKETDVCRHTGPGPDGVAKDFLEPVPEVLRGRPKCHTHDDLCHRHRRRHHTSGPIRVHGPGPKQCHRLELSVAAPAVVVSVVKS